MTTSTVLTSKVLRTPVLHSFARWQSQLSAKPSSGLRSRHRLGRPWELATRMAVDSIAFALRKRIRRPKVQAARIAKIAAHAK
jgi:hypothetical protein